METVIICISVLAFVYLVGYWVERITIKKNEKWKLVSDSVKEILEYLTEDKE